MPRKQPQKLPLLGPTCCLLLICWHMFLIVFLSCKELSSQQNYSNCLWLRIFIYFAFYGVQLWYCRRQATSSYESIQSCALPEPTVLSVLCQAITTTRINNLRAYSAIKQKWRLITQIQTCTFVSSWENLNKYLHVSSHHLQESCCTWETQQHFHSAAYQRLQHMVLCL